MSAEQPPSSESDAVSDEVAKLYDIASRILAAHNHHERALGGRMPDDHRDVANLMLALRGAEYALSAVDDFHFNRPSAGALLGRALLETALTLRWSLQTDDNARRWWREGDAAIQKTLKTLGLSTDPAVAAIRDAPAVGVGLPSFQKMAQEGGLIGPYSRWYATLSAYAHASRMSTGHAYGRARHPPLPPLVMPCIYFANDIGTVFSGWATTRQVPPPWPHP